MTIEIVNSSGRPPRNRFEWMVASRKFSDTAGPLIRTALKVESPVGDGPRRGRLRDSIRYERPIATPDNLVMSFNAYTPYARYVLDGTKEHDIYPKAARYLHFTGRGGGDVFVGPRGSSAHVHHPGTKPNPFNKKAMDRVRPEVQRLFSTIVRSSMGG